MTALVSYYGHAAIVVWVGLMVWYVWWATK